METVLLIFGSAIIGFVFGALVYRNNANKAEAAVKELKEQLDNLKKDIGK